MESMKNKVLVVKGISFELDADNEGYTFVSTHGLLSEQMKTLLDMLMPHQTDSDRELENFFNQMRRKS